MTSNLSLVVMAVPVKLPSVTLFGDKKVAVPLNDVSPKVRGPARLANNGLTVCPVITALGIPAMVWLMMLPPAFRANPVGDEIVPELMMLFTALRFRLRLEIKLE